MKKQNKYKINNKSQKKIRKKSSRKRSLKKKKSQVGSSLGIKVKQIPNKMSEDNVAETLARIRWRRAIEAHVEAIRQIESEKELLDEKLPIMPSLSSSEDIYPSYNSNSGEDGVIVNDLLQLSQI